MRLEEQVVNGNDMIVLRYNIGRSFLFFSGVQIQAHDFQGQTLFIESIGLFHLRFCYHAT